MERRFSIGTPHKRPAAVSHELCRNGWMPWSKIGRRSAGSRLAARKRRFPFSQPIHEGQRHAIPRKVVRDSPACVGAIGIAPQPTSMRKGVHHPCSSSSTDRRLTLRGDGSRVPIGQIGSASMMLEHLGEKEAATDIVTAIERVLAEPSLRTRDHGGRTNT